MKHSLRRILLPVAIVALAMSVRAESRKYPVIQANVDFEFSLGKRIFSPGTYSFIVLGPGLLAIQDPQGRVPAIFMTRLVEASGPAGSTRLVFHKRRQHFQLEEIWPGNQASGIEIVAEYSARSPTAPLPALLPWQLLEPPSMGLVGPPRSRR